jgi:hypothetical protein
MLMLSGSQFAEVNLYLFLSKEYNKMIDIKVGRVSSSCSKQSAMFILVRLSLPDSLRETCDFLATILLKVVRKSEPCM